jgi:Bifunctional DNA primase/polymerase, N-terminal
MCAALNWRHHPIGPAWPCRICHRPALLRDGQGLPCHKVCAEPEPPAVRANHPEPSTVTDHKGMSIMELRPPSEALLRNALDHAARGWHVFPLTPGAKTPAVKAWETRATTNADRIRRCWTAGPFNIGIATGPSDLVVVDLDKPKPGQQAPPEWAQVEGVHDGADAFAVVCERAGQPYPGGTYTVTTGRGGTHLYYGQSGDGPHLRNTAGTLGWLIDTRAHGGYVVAAGSVVNGHSYAVAHDADPLPLLAWLAKALTAASLPPQEPVTVTLPANRAGAYLRAAIDRNCAAVREAGKAGEGRRNQALYGASVALGQLVAGGGLSAHDAIAVLLDAATEAGLGQGEARRTVVSGFRAGARRPRTLASAA